MQDSSKVDRNAEEPVLKADAVIDYNKNMWLIDKSDVISSNDCLCKIMKWYKKAFVHLLDITVLNSYIL